MRGVSPLFLLPPCVLLAALMLSRPASASFDSHPDVLAASTPEARENRVLYLWKSQGEDLARGKPVLFSHPPNYSLTRDDNDPFDLTNGRLASRRDDRIWFARDAVGWRSGPSRGVNWLIDLGEVHPVERLVVRFLGGGSQTNLLFPREITVAASEDGENFYAVSSLRKLMPGEKDLAGKDGLFYLPEEGTAYTYPFLFDGLRTKARYIGLKVTGASDFVFSDAMAVIKGDFDTAGITYEPARKTRFIMEGILLEPFREPMYISTNVTTPNWLQFSDMRREEDRKQEAVFAIELPEEFELLHARLAAGGSVKMEPAETGDRGRTRWLISKPGITHGYNMGPFYFRLKEGRQFPQDASAVFYALSGRYAPNRVEVPVKPVDIPEVPRLQSLHISLAWMSDSYARNWPDFFSAWRHLGFDTISTFPRYWGGELDPEREAFLNEARERGFGILYNESPFHVMVSRNRGSDQIYSQLPDGPSRNACPSYRGEHYRAEIKRVGDLYELTRADYVFHDIELWYRGAREAERCARCMEGLKASGKQPADYLAGLGTEMARDMHVEIAERSRKLGLELPVIGIYHIHAQRPVYHLVLDFNRMYPQWIHLAQPSLYVRGDAGRVREVIRENYRRIGRRDIIPWLTAGTYGEFEPYKLEQMILESFLNGASGITYYWFGNFDGPMDYYYHARPLAALAPYEELLEKGTIVEVSSDNESLSYSAWGSEAELLLLAANYQNSPRTGATVALQMGEIEIVRDVLTGRTLPVPGTPAVSLDVAPQEIKLLYIRGTGR